MTLKQKLQKESRNTIEDYALRFACNLEQTLTEEACDGRTECLIAIDNEHNHILTSPLFISAVSELLEGVKVKVIQIPTSTLFPSIKKDVLQFSWGELND